jgi:CBS domain-containing protein
MPVMGVTARDVMDANFQSLSPETSVAEAVQIFRRVSLETGRRVFGMIVVDAEGRLAGMLSMYDILLLMRPKHIHIWGEMNDIDTEGFISEACRRTQSIRVGDIMSAEVTTISPDTHLLMIVDVMLKKHIRRLPVVEEGRVTGMVYISDVFYRLLDVCAVEDDA